MGQNLIHTIFSGMNIHLPAILMFTRGTRFWHTAISGSSNWNKTRIIIYKIPSDDNNDNSNIYIYYHNNDDSSK